MSKLPVVMIQRFCMHDGPGIRTTVFLKGCPLRCVWCHNPETQQEKQQMYYTPSRCIGCMACSAVCPAGAHCFTEKQHRYRRDLCNMCGSCAAICPTEALESVFCWMDIREIMDEVRKDSAFYGTEGGLTVSGGEPMAHPLETLELLKAAKAAGIGTAVETCGYFAPEYVEPLCQAADTLLWDVKDTDDERHRQNTGVSNRRILSNLFLADRYSANLILKCILLKGVNDTEEHVKNLSLLSGKLKHVKRTELFSYHPLGASKAERLGLEADGRTEWVVPPEEMQIWRSFIKGSSHEVR